MADFRFRSVAALATVALFLCAAVAAADPRIDKIKERYAGVRALECGTGCEQNEHTLTFHSLLAAIGLQTTTVRFLHVSSQADPEHDPYLLTQTLKEVVVTFNVAVSEFLTMEYLYDEGGQLAFYYWKKDRPGKKAEERRFYFFQGSLIRVIADYESDGGDRILYEDLKGFKKTDAGEAKSVGNKAAEYKKLFEMLVTAERWK